MNARGIVGYFIVLALLILWMAHIPIARAHEKWWDGREVDPITKRYCCGDNDIKHLTRDQVKIVPGGYQLADTGEVVPFDRTQPSPDGEFWVFRWGSPVQTQCFFAPIGAM